MELTIEGLGCRYGEFVALSDLAVTVAPGEVLAVLGPSGSGKSTLLHLVAGLLPPTSGRIALGGRVISEPGRAVPPESRGIAMVFQDFALWPHMTVFENIAFPLRVRRADRASTRRRVGELLAMLRIDGLHARYPHELSGGQRQRVAVARALAPRPALMLLDEPMSSLDAQLREAMRVELADTLRSAGTTALYVTHDRTEAMTIADRILLLDGGREVQCGSPQELYERPRNVFAARFMGPANVLRGEVSGAPGDGPAVFTESSTGARLRGANPQRRLGTAVAIFRPEVVRLRDAASPGDGLSGRITHRAYLGHGWQHTVEIAPGVSITASANSPVSGSVVVVVPPEALLLIGA